MHAYLAATKDRNAPSDRTPALRFGSAVDRLVFGVGDEIVVKSKRGQKEQPGTILVTEDELIRAHDIRIAVNCMVPRLADPRLVAEGYILHQEEYEWNSDGVDCLAHPDQVDLDMETVNDLKTARDMSDDALLYAISEYGYHIQMAAYEEAVRVKYGWPMPLLRLAFVGKTAPYEVKVIRMESIPELYSEGKQLWESAKRTWKECVETDTWPGSIEPVKVKPSKTELNNWNNS